MTDIIHK